MSTRPASTAVCIGTFVVLMHLTTAGIAPAHQAALPRTGLSRPHRVVGVVPPVPAAVLRAVCGSAARWGVAAAP
ncbi:hypothetical protein GCM10010269_30180 [Streptomyces humidus]|uniref:Secreted protein n=1 Tax=Streptomyces humidus TaxID=52259 RepID=A0A918FWM6_9ACTN|nr:hypothetical protein [Streptomyces humidus]GGR89065.1 hypothetical protein GCM10010269_30180 [Streptomyces humidus]